jgi:hypothetical protein
MTATEWSHQARVLVQAALDAIRTRDVAKILAIEQKFLQLKQQEPSDVPVDVDKGFREAMFALNDGVIGTTVSDWAALDTSLTSSSTILASLDFHGTELT